MRYVLKNKNTPVLSFEYNQALHGISDIVSILNPEYAPIGLVSPDGHVDVADMNTWWRSRAIPSSRYHLRRLLASTGTANSLELVERNFGLSLSDRYWVDDGRGELSWSDVNYFDNDFSEDLGYLTLGQSSSERHVSLRNPSGTAGGMLQKKWIISDGQRFLIKGGTGAFNQEPYNEVVATRVFEQLADRLDFTPYQTTP